MSAAGTTPSLRMSKASASAFTATPMEQDFLSALAFRSARDFLEQKQHVLDYWGEDNDVLHEPPQPTPQPAPRSVRSPGATPTNLSMRVPSRRKRLVIESAFTPNGPHSGHAVPLLASAEADGAASAPATPARGGWTSGATRSAMTHSRVGGGDGADGVFVSALTSRPSTKVRLHLPPLHRAHDALSARLSCC